MWKAFLIGWKDLALTLRDRTALILMLAAPFLLTLGMGVITGRFSRAASAGIGDIPVVLVNRDRGRLGAALAGVVQSEELAQLLEPVLLDDPAEARRRVDDDAAAAAVIIPEGFSDSLVPAQGQAPASLAVEVEIYANPTRSTGAGVVEDIVRGFLGRAETGRVGGQVTASRLAARGLARPEEAARIGMEAGERLATAAPESAPLSLRLTASGGAEVQFDVLAYLAPGMALMFLMFTVTNGGRALLAERAQGTLPRLLVSPTTAAQVLGGKVVGICLTGTAQVLILIVASTLLFGLRWGDPWGVLILVLAAVVGATGWGMLITAFARTPGQVTAVGSAVMLSFGILGGSFTSVEGMPSWMRMLSRITPNSWGLDGFSTLARGGSLANVLAPIGALAAMGVTLFIAAVIVIDRRGILRS